jgi:hypothetical protein
VKTADSAAIKQNIPTRPREGSVHSGFNGGCAAATLFKGLSRFIHISSPDLPDA